MKKFGLKHTKEDCSSGHRYLSSRLYPGALEKNNSKVALIPGGCTSKLQPLDVCLDKPFKVCRKFFSDYCCTQLSTSENPNNRLKTASKPEVLHWVVAAQSHLSSKPEIIAKSFQVTGILPSLESNGAPDEESSESEAEQDPFIDPLNDMEEVELEDEGEAED